MEALWLIWGGFAVAVGLVIGSFLNVFVARIPEDRSLWPRSACPSCAAPVRWYDNLPVVSYLVLRGRCRDCAAPIPRTYPLVELLGGGIAFLCWRRFVPGPEALDAPHLLAWLVFFTFLSLLLAQSLVDLRHHIIPDETSIYAVPVGILGAAALQWVGYDAWPDVGWRQAVLGALLGGGFLGITALVAELVLGREGLGWGDVKLLAMIGAFLGALPGAFLTLLIGSLIGSIAALVHLAWTRRRAYLPMGPAFALGAAVYVLYGDVLLRSIFPGIALWTETPP